jgi:hypothetical protein
MQSSPEISKNKTDAMLNGVVLRSRTQDVLLQKQSDRIRTWLIGIIVLSVVLRLAAAVVMGNQVVELPGTADQISYHTLALRVVGGYGFTFGQGWWPATRAGEPTAHWSFLYTFYLAGIYFLFGPNPLVARIIQAIIVGILQPYLIYRIGSLVLNRVTGLVSAFLVAVYAYFIYYAGALMTEPFYITAILGVLYFSIVITQPVLRRTQERTEPQRMAVLMRLSVFLGLSLVAAVLLRQLFILFIPFLMIWIWWSSRHLRGWKPIPHLVIPLAVLVVCIAPFTLFNYVRFHRLVLVNTNSGFALYWANHPSYGTQFIPILPSEEYTKMLPPEAQYLDEAALDQDLMRLGIQFILADPVRYLQLSISRIPFYFQFLPDSQSGLASNLSRMLSFGIMWPFMLYGMVRVYLDSRKRIWKLTLANGLTSPAFLLVLFAVIYTGIHVMTWTLVRYRLPVDMVMLMFAAYGLIDLFTRIKERMPQLSSGA